MASSYTTAALPPGPVTLPDLAVAYGVNDSGSVVGLTTDLACGTYATLWTAGSPSLLGNLVPSTPPCASFTAALAINNGQVVTGFSRVWKNPVNPFRAFLWKAGIFQNLGVLAGTTHSVGNAVNENAMVVGYSGNQAPRVDVTSYRPVRTSTAGDRAFAFVGGRMSPLRSLPSATYSYATGVNLSGMIVGASGATDTSEHAVVWKTYTAPPIDLGTLPGGRWSYATAINASGLVVGCSEAVGAVIHAFVYRAGVMQDLGTLPSGSPTPNSCALAITTKGTISGWSSPTSGGPSGMIVRSAALFAPTLVDLGSVAPAGSLFAANGLNNLNIAVGHGGGTEARIWTP
jgi:probable HAF family extracellular repeat protein